MYPITQLDMELLLGALQSHLTNQTMYGWVKWGAWQVVPTRGNEKLLGKAINRETAKV